MYFMYHSYHLHCRNESVYEYVYPPGTPLKVEDTNLTDDSSEILTEPSLPSSNRNTPDLQGSYKNLQLSDTVCAALADTSRPRSSTLPEMNLFSPISTSHSFTLPRIPTHKFKDKSKLKSQNSFDALAEVPPPLPSRYILGADSLKLEELISHSQSYRDVFLEENAVVKRQSSPNKRLSASMDWLFFSDGADIKSDVSEKRYNELVAEPYLHPIEVKEMMSKTLPHSSPSPSPKSEQDHHPSMFMSMRVRAKSRPQLVAQTVLDKTETAPFLTRSTSLEKKGHRRSRSNPWMLDSLPSVSCDATPPKLPPRNTETLSISPLSNPNRPNRLSGSSVANVTVTSPLESSLEFSNRPTLPSTPRRVVSDRSPVKVKDNSNDDICKSGLFRQADQSMMGSCEDVLLESTDPPSSPSDRSISIHNPLDEVLFEEDEDDSSNHYARIEDMQKYVKMVSAPLNIDKAKTLESPRSSVNEMDGVDHQRKTQTTNKSRLVGDTPKKELPSSVSAPLLPWKRKWKKQRTGPIIHEDHSPSAPLDQSSLKQLSTTPVKVSPSHDRKARPLPPSPTKAVRHQFSNDSNIYERIEDVIKWPRKHSFKLDRSDQKWLPPVERELWPKYAEAVTKFFSSAEIRQQWIETLKSVMPDSDVDNISPPYCNQSPVEDLSSDTEEEQEDLTEVEQTSDRGDEDSNESFPSLRTKSVDNLIIINQPNPISPDNPSSPFVTNSDPASPYNVSLTNSNTHFQSPMFRQRDLSSSGRAPSRDDLIQIMNQQLNQDSLSDSETDDDNGCTLSSSESEVDSDLEESSMHVSDGLNSVPVISIQRASVKRKAHGFLQTDLDEALDRRTSESTDSDLVGDLASDLAPIPDNLEVVEDNHVNGGVEIVSNIKPSQFIKKRGSPKRRTQSFRQDVNETTRNLSDSGISNCQSFTYEDGFSILSSQLTNTDNNSESEC